MNIGTKMRSVRKQKQLSQIEVANKAGIAVNSLRLYESGEREPRVETLRKIADALDISFLELVDMGIVEGGDINDEPSTAELLSKSEISKYVNENGLINFLAIEDYFKQEMRKRLGRDSLTNDEIEACEKWASRAVSMAIAAAFDETEGTKSN